MDIDTTSSSSSSSSSVVDDSMASMAVEVTEQESTAAPTFTDGRRLMITKMVMENFKSYAGIQEVGPFHKCFSSVVGPNGSGKSNLIDAMLFVFGKRASQIRLKKVSELIHKSENHRDFEHAKVEVHFQMIIDTDSDDEEAYEVVPDSEFTVSRVAYKNNSSKYFVNGKTSSFAEVTKLLKKWGVDLDNNRFLILQGEVEQISLMKPLELLAYLEDIIGSNKLVEQIEALGTQVEEANEERASKLHRVKVTEKERDSLEGAKLEAERFQAQQREVSSKRAIVYQINASKSQNSIEEAANKLTEAEDAVKEIQASMQEEAESRKEIESRFKVQKDEQEALQKELDKIEADYKEFECNDVRLRQEIVHSRNQQKKLKASIKSKSKSIVEHGNAIDQAQASIEALEGQQNEVEEVLRVEQAALDELYQEVKAETAGLQEQVEAKQQELKPFAAEYAEIKAVVDVMQAEHDLLEQKVEGPAKELAATQEEAAKNEAALEAAREKHSKLSEALARDEAALGEAQSELEQVQAQEGEVAAEVKELSASVADTKAALAAAKSRSGVIKTLMAAQKKGKLSGIVGRLGDLGEIDAAYDVAVSTACGALDHIVVESTDEAQACVEYLKSKQAGMASFIILEKLAYLEERVAREVKVPSGADRLFDLIEPEEESLRVAFYFGVRDTLVAKDLETATKISFGKSKRWRVVTQAGELIDTSGAMTGGGNKVHKGGMRVHGSSSAAAAAGSSKKGGARRGRKGGDAMEVDEVSEKDVARMEARLGEAQAELEEIRQRKADVEVNLMQLSTRVNKTLPTELSIVAMDIESLEARQADLESRLGELEALVAEHSADAEEEERMAELKKGLAKEGKKLDKASKKMETLQAAIAALQTEIAEFSSVKLKAQQYKVDSRQAELDTFGSQMTKARVTIGAKEKKRTQAEEAIAAAEASLEEEKAKMEGIKKELEEMEEEAIAVHKLHAEAKKRLEAKQSELEEMRAAFGGQEKAMNALRAQEVEANAALEDAKRMVREQENKMSHWKNKLAELEQECAGEEGDWFQWYDEEALAEFDAVLLNAEITAAEDSMAEMNPNLAAIKEYQAKEAEFQRRSGELDEVTEKRDAVRKEYDDLRKQRLTTFMGGFSTITMKLKEMYQMITLGGDAELELVDSLDPFAEGIVFSVRPPKKSWKNISNLSGGEKTLSSLSLVFALHHFKPTPLYVMDEIDAALDFKNVSIVAHYIKERTKNAQFVIISLRNNMFELADRLVGIYKTDNTTKSVTINPNKMVVPLSEAN